MGRAFLSAEPAYPDAFEVLYLQAEADGRGPALFGENMSASRARSVVEPFLVGTEFPEVYFELPLAGSPFLDVTLLLGDLEPGTRVDSPLAEGTGVAMDFYGAQRKQNEQISFGYELDCGRQSVPTAAVHFQPRAATELVRPFCDALGEADRADLYLAQNARMPVGWPLSFFGLFRGRPASPLRACGYLSTQEKSACAQSREHLRRAFDRMGFPAFDEAMLGQATRVLALAPGTCDFQLDVLPDGTLGDVFAFDVHFDDLPERMACESFVRGAGAAIVSQLQAWGIADERADLLAHMAFTRGVPLRRDDGSMVSYGFSLQPGWLKVRWKDGVLQPAKMYLHAFAGVLLAS